MGGATARGRRGRVGRRRAGALAVAAVAARGPFALAAVAAHGPFALAAAAVGGALALSGLACSRDVEPLASRSPLPADRREYLAFRGAHPEVREPNYLPFLLHRVREGDEDLLVVCRWDDAAFPLRVGIEAPEISGELADGPQPVDAGVYVRAVQEALARWERELGAPVRFRAAGAGEAVDLRFRLHGDRAPVPEDGKQVLGMTPLGDACRRSGAGGEGRLGVALAEVATDIYVADDYGLLTPEQVETVASHEIGHALGARSHSPLPADLLFEIARDRLGPRRLTPADANSFAALYALPNGTVYARRRADAPPEPPHARPPEGEPVLGEAPYDAGDLGFRVRLPKGWAVIPVESGVAAVDGLAWDYDASLQVLSVPVASIDAYLERYGDVHLRKGPLLGRRDLDVAGRPATRLAVRSLDAETVEEVTLVDAGGGRLVVAISETPVEAYEAYRPWLHAAIESLALEAREPAGGRITPSP